MASLSEAEEVAVENTVTVEGIAGAKSVGIAHGVNINPPKKVHEEVDVRSAEKTSERLHEDLQKASDRIYEEMKKMSGVVGEELPKMTGHVADKVNEIPEKVHEHLQRVSQCVKEELQKVPETLQKEIKEIPKELVNAICFDGTKRKVSTYCLELMEEYPGCWCSYHGCKCCLWVCCCGCLKSCCGPPRKQLQNKRCENVVKEQPLPDQPGREKSSQQPAIANKKND